MASKIELDKDRLRNALNLQIGSMKRAEKAAGNPGIKLLLQKDIAELTVAMNTITDTK